jgi:hypothetical protein
LNGKERNWKKTKTKQKYATKEDEYLKGPAEKTLPLKPKIPFLI